ncbi:MAG: hypothetical protein CMJ81_08745 [Planctomycetaceae bacterium]|nr:hypothetical protein [Planctomycetaceae bacterium]MBP61724.1 hypothetical protein [Planctomycetaceae bacterium]
MGIRDPVVKLFDWIVNGTGHGTTELARRLGIPEQELRTVDPVYHAFSIPKRSGGTRKILAPEPRLKRFQRLLLRRVFAKLSVHPAATGFEPGRSIVTNARTHQGQAVVLRFDLIDFFSSTSTKRLRKYFRQIGWNRPASKLLLRLCTQQGGLPQGAPTSPRLSNLLNYRLDARLAGLIVKLRGRYTRYADDITISFATRDLHAAGKSDFPARNSAGGTPNHPTQTPTGQDTIRSITRAVQKVIESEGYRMHHRKKLSVRRQHQQQVVTGLVVNQRVNLPRSTRRWLRAVEHRTQMSQPLSLTSYQPGSYSRRKSPTLSPAQLEGWRSFRAMVQRQAIDD